MSHNESPRKLTPRKEKVQSFITPSPRKSERISKGNISCLNELSDVDEDLNDSQSYPSLDGECDGFSDMDAEDNDGDITYGDGDQGHSESVQSLFNCFLLIFIMPDINQTMQGRWHPALYVNTNICIIKKCYQSMICSWICCFDAIVYFM